MVRSSHDGSSRTAKENGVIVYSQPAGHELRRLVMAIYVPTFLVAMGRGMVLPVRPLFARDLGAGLGETGLIVALFGIGSLMADLPAGALVSRFSHKRITIGAVGAAALFSAATGFVTSAPLLGALTILSGFSISIWFLTRLDYLRHAVKKGRRGRALAILGGAGRLGFFIGPMVGGLLGERFGLHFAFWGEATCFALATLFLTGVPRLRGSVRTNGETAFGRTLREHKRVFLTATLSMVALALVRAGRSLLIPLWGDAIGLDVAAVGLVVGLAWGTDMLLFYPVGMIMDKVGRKWTALPCFGLLSASLFLLPTARTLPMLLLVVMLAGIGNGFGSGINMTLSTDMAPRDSSGSFLGLWRLMVDTGTVAGPFLVGVVAHAATLGTAALAVGGVGLVGATILLVSVPEPIGGKGRRVKAAP